MNDATRRAIRTAVQLVAAGGLTWLTEQLAKDLPAAYVPYLLGCYTVLVTLCQNKVEEWSGKGLLKGTAGNGVPIEGSGNPDNGTIRRI